MSVPPPLVEPLEGLGDPAEVAGRFLDLPWLLLLDSASAGSGIPDIRALGRYSFLSADPTAVVRSKGKVPPNAFRAFGYQAPGHFTADLRLKWRDWRMRLGVPPAAETR